jgi:hypothetical protein
MAASAGPKSHLALQLRGFVFERLWQQPLMLLLCAAAPAHADVFIVLLLLLLSLLLQGSSC